MLLLRCKNLHWIDGSADDSRDLCAHSRVEFRVDGEALIQPNDGDWAVSAAALYLLRTLSQPHTSYQRVAEHLFPCCGNAMFEADRDQNVVIVGCNKGIDFEVAHRSTVVLTTKAGRTFEFAADEWRKMVWAFADAVQAFYDASSPKIFEDEDDARGFKKFWSEWSRRRSVA